MRRTLIGQLRSSLNAADERTYTADWSSGPSIAWQDEAGVDAQPILKAAREHP
jgi:hypothetical protein